MRKLLSEYLQSPRYKLLFFIYQHRKIDPSIEKSRLARAFGYKSDGHFYEDLDVLKGMGLVVEDNQGLRITRKGRKEFMPIGILWLGAVLSFLYGIKFLETYWVFLQGTAFIIPPLLA